MNIEHYYRVTYPRVALYQVLFLLIVLIEDWKIFFSGFKARIRLFECFFRENISTYLSEIPLWDDVQTVYFSLDL